MKFGADVLLWTLATPLAYLMRFDGNPGAFMMQFLMLTGVLFVVKAVVVVVFGSYRQSWRNTSYIELFQILRMTGLVSIFLMGAVLLLRDVLQIPLSIPFLEFLTSVAMLMGMRASVRFILKYRFVVNGHQRPNTSKVIIAGAGESGTHVAKELLKHPSQKLTPVAFLDDDPLKNGQKIFGLPVAGTIDDLGNAAQELGADEVIIAMPSESGSVIRRVVEKAREAGLRHRTIPGFYDLVSGNVAISQIRDVDVEDLLRREPVVLDTEQIEGYVEGKTILVTGAGGSIGSEIVRQVSRFCPAKLVFIGRGENSLHRMLQSFRKQPISVPYTCRICDIRDRDTLECIIREERPDVIYHAAAHKHVPFMEENPAQAVLNNVCGTQNLVELSLEYGVSHFVNISTDKAVNPTSVMGASKRIAEKLVEWGSVQAGENQSFVSVRFGNVLGSRGSVIPIFRDQIKSGGPVTVTHPDMIRYFMTIPEASQLVLQAGSYGRNGAVFILDMGEPVNIEDMARDLIRLSGFEPDEEIEVVFTGMRPGEKLYEELMAEEEGTEETGHDKIMAANHSAIDMEFPGKLKPLFEAAKRGEGERVKQEIARLIPTYSGVEV